MTSPPPRGVRAPFVYRRPVRFEEVDAAGLVFFGRFPGYAHEAMEAFFGALDGGYVGLVRDRRSGVPAVELRVRYASPLRYGDLLDVTVTTTHVGTTSVGFHYRFEVEGRHVATVDHAVVFCDLDAMEKRPLPPDVRALVEAHLVAGGGDGSA